LALYIKKRGLKHRSDDLYSQSGDNEASGKKKEQIENSEVSFVLERKSTEGSNSPNKLGLFGIALVMCVCCFSSFFAPMTSSGATSSDNGSQARGSV
jgi:hypothetical protein